jgi:hypothetical protein
MNNSIVLENPDDIANERAAVAMLLAAAKEAAAAEAPAPEPVPVGGIDDLHDLFEQQKVLGNQLQALKTQEAELTLQLQSIREEAAAIERQGTVLKEKAARLFEIVFGKPKTPRQVQTPSVVKFDERSDTSGNPLAHIPSLSL